RRGMRKALLMLLFSLTLCLVIVGILVTSLWSTLSNRSEAARGALKLVAGKQATTQCKECREKANIDKLAQVHSQTWQKQESRLQAFRAQLNMKCHGFSRAIITQANTLLGSKVMYDGERRKPVEVTPKLYSTFPKEHPFGNVSFQSCAVVGNGGILANSSCGEEIDGAQFVIRCNLPPVDRKYQDDVGNKTDLVTANPSILLERFEGLMEVRRPFVESLGGYGQPMLALPAFSYGHNTPVSLRVVYALQDFNSPVRAVFLNPEYLQNLARFWKAHGLRTVRLSTGLIVASLALELCASVTLYGFWPFSLHPFSKQHLTNHYYDDKQSKKSFHAMPAEFEHLLRLHSQGVIRVHLGSC
ncbi:SIA8E sialyltransferase, partial [Atractosteus spatula]|nr:SIA8E sialyltransferase [Atractosteus spatula]